MRTMISGRGISTVTVGAGCRTKIPGLPQRDLGLLLLLNSDLRSGLPLARWHRLLNHDVGGIAFLRRRRSLL